MPKQPAVRHLGAVTCVGLAGLVLLSVFLLARQGPPPAHADDTTPAKEAKAAVREVLDRQAAAWNKGDLDGFMAGYWKSPDLTFFSGKTREHGWQATLDRYRRRYQGEGREMGRLTFDQIQIDVLGPDAALVRGRWELVRKDDRPGGLFTLVFRKFPEGWRIIHDHTSS
ncbi:MAG TPA: nuclear transport factor 2 family protein [Gemmataceae bacterium]|nr:nuclear transport factor 2 family protein [Gemmataceae bacterium]